MKIPPPCIMVLSDPIIVCEEKLSKIVFNNSQRREVKKILVDDCVIRQGLRCDYLLLTDDATELYVELKGSDISHAVQQLEATIAQLSQKRKGNEKYCFIISSRSPLASPKIQELKIRFKKMYNASLQIKNRIHTHTL